MKTNYISECAKKAYNKELVGKAYEDCRMRFNLFHVLNYLMHEEALKAIDVLEEQKALKFNKKKYWKCSLKVYDTYRYDMQRSSEYAAWFLLQDYCNAAYEDLEPKLTMLEVNSANYMYKMKYTKNVVPLSKLVCALKIGELITTLRPKYFQTYKKICGVDFSKSFAYADMKEYIRNLLLLYEALAKGQPKIDFGEDIPTRNSATVIEDRLAEDDFLDKAAVKALQYSDKYRPQYEAMKEKAKEVENNEIKELLATKFKVIDCNGKF